MAAIVAALGGRVVVRVEEVANKPSDFKPSSRSILCIFSLLI
jgi:hypothetical protein